MSKHKIVTSDSSSSSAIHTACRSDVCDAWRVRLDTETVERNYYYRSCSQRGGGHPRISEKLKSSSV